MSEPSSYLAFLEGSSTDPEFREQITKIATFINTNENHFVQAMKNMNALQTQAELDRAKTQFSEDITGVTQAFKAVGMLGSETRNESIRKMSSLGIAATQIYTASHALMAANALSSTAVVGQAGAVVAVEAMSSAAALGHIGVIAMGAMTIYSIFTQDDNDNDSFKEFAEALFKNLGNISDQISSLHEALRKLFNINFETLQTILKENRDFYAALSNKMDWHFAATSSLLKNLQNSITQLGITTIKGQNDIFLQSFTKDLNIANSYISGALKENKQVEIPKVTETLTRRAQHHGESSAAILTGNNFIIESHSDDSFYDWIKTVLPNTNRDTVEMRVGFLADYAKHLGIAISKESLEAAYNMNVQFLSVNALLRLGKDHAADMPDPEDHMISWYDLELISKLPGNDRNRAEAGKIYLSSDGTFLIRDFTAKVQSGSLNINLDNLPNRLRDESLKKQILEATSHAAHKLINSILTANSLNEQIYQGFQSSALYFKLFDLIKESSVDIENLCRSFITEQNNKCINECGVALDIENVDKSLGFFNEAVPDVALTGGQLNFTAGDLTVSPGKLQPLHYLNAFDVHSINRAFMLLHRLGLLVFHMPYDVDMPTPGWSHKGTVRIDVFAAFTSSSHNTWKLFDSTRNLTSPIDFSKSIADNLISWLLEKGKGKEWLAFTTCYNDALDHAILAIKNVFLAKKKLAMMTMLNSPAFAKALAKRDAAIRLLKSFAHLAGFKQSEIALLNQLHSAEKIKNDIGEYIKNADYDTPLPIPTGTDNVAHILHHFMTNAYSSHHYFQCAALKAIATMNNGLRAFKTHKTVVIQKKAAALRLAQEQAERLSRLHQEEEKKSESHFNNIVSEQIAQGMGIAEVFATSFIVTALLNNGYSDEATLLAGNDRGILSNDDTIPAGLKHGLLHGVSSHAMSLLPKLYAANKLTAVNWLCTEFRSRIDNAIKTPQNLQLVYLTKNQILYNASIQSASSSAAISSSTAVSSGSTVSSSSSTASNSNRFGFYATQTINAGHSNDRSVQSQISYGNR